MISSRSSSEWQVTKILKSKARCHRLLRKDCCLEKNLAEARELVVKNFFILFLNSNKEKLLSKQSDGFHFSVIYTHVRKLKGHYFWLNTQNCHLQFVYSLQYVKALLVWCTDSVSVMSAKRWNVIRFAWYVQWPASHVLNHIRNSRIIINVRLLITYSWFK